MIPSPTRESVSRIRDQSTPPTGNGMKLVRSRFLLTLEARLSGDHRGDRLYLAEGLLVGFKSHGSMVPLCSHLSPIPMASGWKTSWDIDIWRVHPQKLLFFNWTHATHSTSPSRPSDPSLLTVQGILRCLLSACGLLNRSQVARRPGSCGKFGIENGLTYLWNLIDAFFLPFLLTCYLQGFLTLHPEPCPLKVLEALQWTPGIMIWMGIGSDFHTPFQPPIGSGFRKMGEPPSSSEILRF